MSSETMRSMTDLTLDQLVNGFLSPRWMKLSKDCAAPAQDDKALLQPAGQIVIIAGHDTNEACLCLLGFWQPLSFFLRNVTSAGVAQIC